MSATSCEIAGAESFFFFLTLSVFFYCTIKCSAKSFYYKEQSSAGKYKDPWYVFVIWFALSGIMNYVFVDFILETPF